MVRVKACMAVKNALVAICYKSVGNCARSVGGLWGDSSVRDRLSERLSFAYYDRGRPYPMFWREIMEKRQLNKEFRRFCRFFLKRSLMK
jgi:hypothetical protein